MISGKNISLRYNTKTSMQSVLKNVSFELKEGRIITFMGQSGAGKTTLLKCIANLLPNYKGIISYNGRNLKDFSPVERASTVGFVLQQFHLFPHLSVLNNCTYALIEVLHLSKDEAEERAIEILTLLRMEAYLNSSPAQLSGGQQQRVAIARALVLRPIVLLLDEPTSALDPDSKKSLQTLLLDLNERGITIALSSHDMPFIRRVMDDVYFLEKGELVEEWDKEKEPLESKPKIKQFLAHD